MLLSGHSINTILIDMKIIKRIVVIQEKVNQYCTTKSNGKAKDIDTCKNLSLNKVPPGDFKIASKHDFRFLR